MNFFEEKEQEKIKMMVLAGGSSLLYGAVEYFTKSLGLEVQVSNPFMSIEAPPQYTEFIKKNLPFFTVAAGLVMKNS
jgi:Tfp pilus assembly PilM family ATPase